MDYLSLAIMRGNTTFFLFFLPPPTINAHPNTVLTPRYFGGELTIMSMEGYGTDSFIYLPRLNNQKLSTTATATATTTTTPGK